MGLRIYLLSRESRTDYAKDLLPESGILLLLRQLLCVSAHSAENVCVPGTGNALKNVPCLPIAFLVQIEP